MAVPAENGPEKKNLPVKKGRPLTTTQILAAQLLGQGLSRGEVARRMKDQLCPRSKESSKLQQARNRLRKWCMREDFRELIWQSGLNQLDAESGQILKGIGRKAKAGRVDAARLSLEVTGRHTPNAEVTPAVVQVVFSGLPRPQRAHLEADYDADPDEEVEEVEED